MVRSFSVRAYSSKEARILGDKLDKFLCDLQDNGWDILSVVSIPVKEYDFPVHFDSLVFTIIAKKSETQVVPIDILEIKDKCMYGLDCDDETVGSLLVTLHGMSYPNWYNKGILTVLKKDKEHIEKIMSNRGVVYREVCLTVKK